MSEQTRISPQMQKLVKRGNMLILFAVELVLSTVGLVVVLAVALAFLTGTAEICWGERCVTNLVCDKDAPR